MASRDDIEVAVGGAVLSGSIWKPQQPASSVVLMLPGSGPSTRHNDELFPRLRPHLLAAGHAVASFDKRGVGASTGRYVEATIERQAGDAGECLDALKARFPATPLGLLGHSQGGWAAFEVAAQRDDLAFVVSNSGPGVGPALQERARRLALAEHADRLALGAVFDRLVDAAREDRSLDDARQLADPFPEFFPDVLTVSEDEWQLGRKLFAYEPASAIAQLTAPTLVLHGTDDEMIPVDASMAEFARIANPAIGVELVAAAGHRFLTSSETGFVEGYLDVLLGFIREVVGT